MSISVGEFIPPISKAREEAVLELLAREATRLEKLKLHARIACKADGMGGAEFDALIPSHPAGASGI